MTSLFLDDIWQWPKQVPVIALDLRVCLHKLLPSYFIANKDMPSAEALEARMNAIWAFFINKPIQGMGSAQIIVCDDYKYATSKYWRSKYYAPYKANRTNEADRDSSYGAMLNSAYAYIEHSNLPILRSEGFEADDQFAMLAKLWKGNRTLLMYTCDQDISQLVDDSRQILFYNSMPSAPRLRSEYEVLVHYNRFGNCITKPADIAKHKQIYGDSDNIAPCEAPLGIIDLHEPLLRPEEPDWLGAWLANEKANNSEQHYSAAKKWLLKNGLGNIVETSASW